MAKFRKKPVVIEAMQLKRDNLKAIETFLAGREMPDLYQKLGGWDINWGNSEVTISTLEGKMKARPGDWIIKGTHGVALPLAWGRLREGGRLAGISFHSLEDRRVKHFFADRAQGCICPPDLPVCGCGRTPEAELITRRGVVPTPGEVANNPRSASARLRVARKLEVPS